VDRDFAAFLHAGVVRMVTAVMAASVGGRYFHSRPMDGRTCGTDHRNKRASQPPAGQSDVFCAIESFSPAATRIIFSTRSDLGR